jgi:CheY-like chemotaxis protein
MTSQQFYRGEGTHVRAELPRVDDSATRRPLSIKTIVIVDDESGLADILSAALLNVGYRVHTAWNGALGLEAIAAHSPDLVILDYTMPVLDGAGVLAAMQANRNLASVPVVMMSAMAEAIVRQRCAGFAAFVRKPFELDVMLGEVGRTLGDNRDNQ